MANRARKIVIIGGIAAGISMAMRARRLSEDDDITVIERGDTVSYANCGLPYFLGGVIAEREHLLIATVEELWKLYKIKVFIKTEAIEINRLKRLVKIRSLTDRELDYDELIITTGSKVLMPNIPGIESERIFTLNTLSDMDRLKGAFDSMISLVVVGADYIGLELVDNAIKKGSRVTLIEQDNQVLPSLDIEMSKYVQDYLRIIGAKVLLGRSISSFETTRDSVTVNLKNGSQIVADYCVISARLSPNSDLAKSAGLSIGESGGIIVNERMCTSDEHIFAAGDVIECPRFAQLTASPLALAGPANKQGHLIADILGKSDETYKGSVGASICKICDMSVGIVGAKEKQLLAEGIAYRRIYLHPMSHASYYPGAHALHMKIIFSPESELILGAQILGLDGVDKRIDIISTAIQAKMKVTELANLELAYSPPYGSVRDPINFAGMISSNLLKGLVKFVESEHLAEFEEYLLIDVRTEEEYSINHIPGSINIPLESLRQDSKTIHKDTPIVLICSVGIRSYKGCRILQQKGFNVFSLNGGINIWRNFQKDVDEDLCEQEESHTQDSYPLIDARGMSCTGPIIILKEFLKKNRSISTFDMLVTDQLFAGDIDTWCDASGYSSTIIDIENGEYKFRFSKIKRDEVLTTKGSISQLPLSSDLVEIENKRLSLGMCIANDDLDRVTSALMYAQLAQAFDKDIFIFFIFSGVKFATKAGTKVRNCSCLSFGNEEIVNSSTCEESYANTGSIEPILTSLIENGANVVACGRGLQMLGLGKEDLVDNIKVEGMMALFSREDEFGSLVFV